MSDLTCPYCNAENEICHDDGFGYKEDVPHEIECTSCMKNFVFYTSLIFHYEGEKADCLNGGECSWVATKTIPRIYTRMRCADCGSERKCTEEEKENLGHWKND